MFRLDRAQARRADDVRRRTGGRRGRRRWEVAEGAGEPRSHLKTAQMITEPEGLDDHGCSFSQRGVTECTDFLATH